MKRHRSALLLAIFSVTLIVSCSPQQLTGLVKLPNQYQQRFNIMSDPQGGNYQLPPIIPPSTNYDSYPMTPEVGGKSQLFVYIARSRVK